MKIAASIALLTLAAIGSEAGAQCIVSPTHFCVSHNGSAFVVNGQSRRQLTLTTGITYEFQLINVPGSHPFYFTTSPLGGGIGVETIANVTPQFPQSGNTLLTFTPSRAQAGTPCYYQCAIHEGMGARITIVAAPCPGDFNHDNVVDHFDYLDFVSAFSNQTAGADFNNDSVIDFFDYLDFLSAFNTPCT